MKTSDLVKMKVGDLVKLKGFKNSNPNEIPHGLICVDLGLQVYKVKWFDEEIAKRWAVTAIMNSDKLELVNSASQKQTCQTN